MEKPDPHHIHVVAFNVPYPADYGGVIDIYYKLVSLSRIGMKITLHCFTYGRGIAGKLDDICEKVYYYDRSRFVNPFSGKLPYIVKTRSSPELLENLKKDNFPILFEGLHTSFYLNHPDLKDRIRIVRSHNLEHDYYNGLAKLESNPLKRIYLNHEAARLVEFEKVLKNADRVLGISPSDTRYFNSKGYKTHFIPAFHPNFDLKCQEGKGEYILYHGNLSVKENEHAALYLVNNVFNLTSVPVIIAGNNPSRRLISAIRKHSHVKLAANPNVDEMLRLIEGAQINILITEHGTGLKLKLLNALFRGRHCIVNSLMVQNTGLESLCHVKDSPMELAEKLFSLWSIPFTQEDMEDRRLILKTGFDNIKNAMLIKEYIAETAVAPEEMKGFLN
jgi:hypothetical protein